MLVLTRKVGEKININENVIITVVEISKGNVRIGIEAPREVSILRQEVYENIQNENLNSSHGTSIGLEQAARMWRKKMDKKGYS